MSTNRVVGGVGAAVALTLLCASAGAAVWGATGHRMVGEAAAARLPADVPAFFRSASGRLAWLNAEPDRWREDESVAMDEAFKYDHYIDLENVPAGALDAPDRWEYLEALYAAGLAEPERDAGFLPYRILELQQRLTNGFARWRAASASSEARSWIEQRIVDDAGILGHYVADAAQPHHTTIHFNGWAEDASNPAGYTTSRDFHWRFESRYVDAHVTYEAVLERVAPRPAALEDVRSAVLDYIRASHAQVEPLYRLEQGHGFEPDRAPAPEAEAFTVARLAAAAEMLSALWYTAWIDSGRAAGRTSGR